MKESQVNKIVAKVFPNWSILSNYEYNRLGRIWVIWSEETRITTVFKSGQLITCSILLPSCDEEFFCSFVYASNYMEERKELWEDLRHHKDSPMFRTKPWLICGDFNETLEIEEHSNHATNPHISTGMRDFQDTVRYCSLTNLGYHGPLFTWCNKREEGLICKKLDRALVNSLWVTQYPNSYAVFEAGGCSDHARGRLHFDSEQRRGRKPFKFANVLAKLPQFTSIVKEYWENTEPLYISTSTLYRYSKKLKGLKPLLRDLGKEKLGDLPRRTKEAYTTHCAKQANVLLNPSQQTIKEEGEAYEKWQGLAFLEEEFLKQTSKLHWLNVGDQNNSFFQNSVEQRKMRNTIREVRNQNGTILTKGNDIKSEAERFFKDLLTTIPSDFIGMAVEDLAQILDFRCSQADREWLEKDVTFEEIKTVVFGMTNNKSPGPDGFTCEFFKSTWEINGSELVNAIKSFFIKGFLPKGLNSTILSLIPKKAGAMEMKDFRPISCCNVLYKVISKLLANRLKEILPRFIAQNQSAFVKERLLMENVLLATELVKDYHKETVTPRCAMKIDISKAFDTVQWSFLLNILKALNFPDLFVHWIRLCITTASFSVQVNGELAGYFGSQRGLRQGCSLSPYLFVICMNVLSKMIDKEAASGNFGYHPKCKSVQLTHLCFADDIMIFMDGRPRSVERVVNIFESFTGKSGLRISVEKSTIHLAGISNQIKNDIVTRFPFDLGKFPVRYLGLPLMTKKMTMNDCTPLLESIRHRIASWTTRLLSYAGRLELLKSVIASIINFWISAFRLPNGCIKEIDRLCSAFLWSGPELNTRKAKVSWVNICKPKKEGGLGIRPLKEANQVCCMKLIWRIVSSSSSLWVKWVKNMIIRNDSFWTCKGDFKGGSWMWRKLIKYRERAKDFHKMEIRNGDNTSFWYDHWCVKGRLNELLGRRGTTDLGINKTATVGSVLQGSHRARRHRVDILNEIEEEICQLHQRSSTVGEDISLWRGKHNKFKTRFSTKETWDEIRQPHPQVNWFGTVWFKFATPKYTFLMWLATQNRLTTGDRLRKWGVGQQTGCNFCDSVDETRDHLFFECRYSSAIWTNLAGPIMGTGFSKRWNQINGYISNSILPKTMLFLLKYVLHSTVYHIWKERNCRRHGSQPIPTTIQIKLIDKNVRNRISSIRSTGNKDYEDGLIKWFGTRSV